MLKIFHRLVGVVQILLFLFSSFVIFESEFYNAIICSILSLLSGIILVYFSFKKEWKNKLPTSASTLIFLSQVVLVGTYLFLSNTPNSGPGFGNIHLVFLLLYPALGVSCIGSAALIMKVVLRLS